MAEKIIETLGLHKEIDIPESEDLLRERETAGFDIGENYDVGTTPVTKKKINGKGKDLEKSQHLKKSLSKEPETHHQ